MCRTKHAVLECRRSKALLKQVVNEAAGEKIPEAYFLEYVEDFSSRERSWAIREIS